MWKLSRPPWKLYRHQDGKFYRHIKTTTHGQRVGEVGWGMGEAPPLASKNQSPPLEPMIRDLQKIIWKIVILQKKISDFFSFLHEEMALILPTNLLFFLMFLQENLYFLLQNLVCPPRPLPLPLA